MVDIERTMRDILLAEAEASKMIEKAKIDANEYVKKSGINDENLRSETIQKLLEERNQLELELEEKKSKIFDEMQKSSKSQINKLRKKCEGKKEEITEHIVREILIEWQ